MLGIAGRTIGDVLDEAASRYGGNPFLIVPGDPERIIDPQGRTLSFADVRRGADVLAGQLRNAGYGNGHRIAVLLENRPENLLVKFACATLGISWVPINPDYRAAELAYLLEDSGAVLAIASAPSVALLREGVAQCGRAVPIIVLDRDLRIAVPAASRAAPCSGPATPRSEASLLYTSGTTGRPKGCILSHEYELILGEWYASRGGLMTINNGTERLYNALPLFHVNAGIVSLYAMMLTGNAQILPERFSRTRWWREIRETQATIIHYLGVIIPVLLSDPPGPQDREHHVRFGFGAGLEPTLHRIFEDRFGFPLIEGWGMTEMCKILVDNVEPRQIDTRAMGRPQPGLEVRVVDERGHDVPAGESGEMVVRHSAENPRHGAFSGYLNLPDATETAWRGGWFHTGDTVRQDASGMLFFVDRKKNIIRRSGENIAAAEVEACIQGLADVAQVAVVAVADELREEEVFACVVLKHGSREAATAQRIFDHCFAQLAYYKAPGWLAFVDDLPVTGTQKVLKHMIFAEGEDPLSREGTFDFRALKKRSPAGR